VPCAASNRIIIIDVKLIDRAAAFDKVLMMMTTMMPMILMFEEENESL